jgi:hypothetical protein
VKERIMICLRVGLLHNFALLKLSVSLIAVFMVTRNNEFASFVL